jgi:hypothetical protein
MNSQSEPQAWATGNSLPAPTLRCRINIASRSVKIPSPDTSAARSCIGLRVRLFRTAWSTYAASRAVSAPFSPAVLLGTRSQTALATLAKVKWPSASVVASDRAGPVRTYNRAGYRSAGGVVVEPAVDPQRRRCRRRAGIARGVGAQSARGGGPRGKRGVARGRRRRAGGGCRVGRGRRDRWSRCRCSGRRRTAASESPWRSLSESAMTDDVEVEEAGGVEVR